MLRMTAIFQTESFGIRCCSPSPRSKEYVLHSTKDRGVAGHGVQKQLQSNNRVSDAKFPDKYAPVADDSYFSNRELGNALLLTFSASERVSPTTIRSKFHHHPITCE